ncbi:protein FAR1-RELATED SEQUENCE 6-like [Vigna unguiculata]|uniref:protein FAR1-RELATED SEQUENCE 6-like n=1 Tax=Vigna unguiculata TaxID=3917 RepID=UPI001015E684|nr:protein FAR1-RELATED SEQUENCE 6-like [Vigna unguiculata]XP_027938557.1 protein FAR1-RELATED SEQUENCE 6-like [Vigna unguiculata]XP_027938561.1 protein FAR1-RELATED SEQUENCE 6-like [Vigna unguiculata]XP_027938567.1 protein FAR1-RELATED SEQUENCE 6-like [Vigna unguiculata]
MGERCHSDAPLDIISIGNEEHLISRLPKECKIGSISLDENDDDYPVPRPGMIFRSEAEARLYYTKYADQMGFSVKTRTSKRGGEGKVKYLILVCSERSRTAIDESKKQYCTARINLTLRKDGTYQISAVTLGHNHELGSQRITIEMKCIRKLDPEVIDMGVKKISEQNNCGNYLQIERHWIRENGDGDALQKYLVRMQEQDRNFFYAVDLDDMFSAKNVFWSDGRSRAAYESFGDVVTVDTTCLSNHYKVPLVTFIGVNHHGQSVLFGCGLLSSDDSESFAWLFESLLHCMSGVPPQGIVTDHCCRAMQKALDTVYPSIRHRWCLSNIMEKLPQLIHEYANCKSLRDRMHSVVYDTPTTDEFEGKWKRIVEDFGLKDNKWLKELFLERHRWAPSFVRGGFWAGMCTNPQSESRHAIFDGFINQQTTLKQFVDQYNNALQYKAEKEYIADIHSSSNSQTCVTKSPLERQFQSAYTHAKFLEVQREFVGKADCNVFVACEDGSICRYNVIEDMITEDKPKESVVEVIYNREDCDIKCNCRLFELRGILCRHSLAVLSQERVKEVPCKYILDRWKKNILRKHVCIKTSYGVVHFEPQVQRFDLLCKQFNSIAAAAAEFEGTSSFVKDTLCNLKEKLDSWTSLSISSSLVDVEKHNNMIH